MSITDSPASDKMPIALSICSQTAETENIQTKHLTPRSSTVAEAARRAIHDLKDMLSAGGSLLLILEDSKIWAGTTHSFSTELSKKVLSTACKVEAITELILEFEKSVIKTKEDESACAKQLRNISEELATFSKEVRTRLTELHVEVSEKSGNIRSLSRTIKTIESSLDDALSFADSVVTNKFAYSAEDLEGTKAPLDDAISIASLAFEKGKKTIVASLQKKRKSLSELLNSMETEQEIQQIDKALEAIPKRKLLTPIIDADHLSATFSCPRKKNSPGSKALGIEITRIISNTLSNAVKYGGENTQFSAAWVPDQASDKSGYLELTFKDDGDGIQLNPELTQDKSPRQIDELAKNKLFPSKPTTRQESNTGSGFGGYNIHQVMDELGGRITVKTKGGTIAKGSEIIFRIPLTVKSTGTTIKLAEIAPSTEPLLPFDDMVFPSTPVTGDNLQRLRTSRMKVIIVEDNKINMKLALNCINTTFGTLPPSPKKKLTEIKKTETEAQAPRERTANGSKPVTFTSGKEAMENDSGCPPIFEAIEQAILEKRPVVLILDNHAGAGPSGHTISREIHSWCNKQAAAFPKRATAYHQVRIYSFTAESSMTQSEKALYHGCLTKPINGNCFANGLLAAIKKAK